jgi:Flp pilus assembly protein TadG
MRRFLRPRRILDFLGDQRGNTAIIFGLVAIPLVALGGGSVDFARRARIDSEIQNAADTAALAAARHVQQGLLTRTQEWPEIKASAEAVAKDIVDAVLAEAHLKGTPALQIAVTQETVSVSARYDVKTAFLGIIGTEELPVSTLSEVAVPDPILVEIAFVLDYSLSMHQNSKYQRMTDAARSFIAKVKAERADRTKVAIVPFSEFVYADVPKVDVRDPDTETAGAWGGGSTSDGTWNWTGGTDTGTGGTEETGTSAVCLLNRDYPYSTTDETPTGLAATQWQQADPTSERCEKYQSGGLKARELTDDFDGLSSALGAMSPVGWTNIALAAEMGWHMLSPNEPFETARSYTEPYLQKIMVLLTDGVQTVEAMGPGGATSIEAANETTAELCENAKASKIKIYTIAYDVDDTSVYNLLSNCASGADAYFEVHDSSGIDDVFKAIYAQIVESAWLSK